jgi:hypothetical protein
MAWLRAGFDGRPIGVDREKQMIRGYVVAQLGPFKTPGRGEFDRRSLEQIVKLTNAAPKGLKSRFAHPTLSSDGVGKFLGRVKNARLDGDRVRGDLHLDPSSFNTPNGNLGGYVLALAESDSDALSSSLVLTVDKEIRLNKDGSRKADTTGEPLPPLWRPKQLHASDVVDTGDAVDGMLSIDTLPDSVVRHASDLLDRAFPDLNRAELTARARAWLNRYLDRRFG